MIKKKYFQVVSLKECLILLDAFKIDYTQETIKVTTRDRSCVLNPNSNFYNIFKGNTLHSVIKYVAKELNKPIEYID